MRSDERALIRRARRGSPDAVEELFRLHWRGVWQAAYAVTSRRELANDVAQGGVRPRDVVARALRRIAAVRAVADSHRREPRDRRAPPRATARPRRDRRDTGRGRARERRPVVQAVARLGPEKRLIVALHYWLDYSIPEIARLLELPLGTVASRLSRALEELRLDLEAEHV